MEGGTDLCKLGRNIKLLNLKIDGILGEAPIPPFGCHLPCKKAQLLGSKDWFMHGVEFNLHKTCKF
ncbi:hypothetical protein SCA6_007983 [Theobroma cacao]